MGKSRCEPLELHVGVSRTHEKHVSLKNGFRYSGGATRITADTEIYIWFDSSGSMDSTLAPLQSMRDNNLKDALLPFYGNDEDLYDGKVTVQSWSDERFLRQIATEPENLEFGIIHLVFQDEAEPTYTGSTFDSSTRTSNYDTDLAALKDKLENTFQDDLYQAFMFQVETGTSGTYKAFKDLLLAAENGTDVYASPNGFSGIPLTIEYDVVAASTAEYYTDLVTQAIFSTRVGQVQQRDRYYWDVAIEKAKELDVAVAKGHELDVVVCGEYESTPPAPEAPTGFTVEVVEVEPVEEEFTATDEGSDGEIQEFIVPENGDYLITAYGAQGGGHEGGLGAKIAGEFSLSEGDIIKILVGQQGLTGQYSSSDTNGGGGGGSFAVLDGATDETGILVIAGGGGGSMANYSQNKHAVIGTTAQDGVIGGAGNTGSGGSNGGEGGYAHDRGGGAAGFISNAVPGGSNVGTAYSYLNGGNGGSGGNGGDGGFGGGGGSDSNGWHGAGGGGGYSGGGGASGRGDFDHVGGGGASYNNGTNQENETEAREGHGLVTIIKV